jgi:DNA-3-methyladenine glycosylase
VVCLISVNKFAFLEGQASQVAPQLLGCLLEREINGQKLIGRIVEVEAYDETDASSHSYKGRTARTEVMFGPSGFLYVYFTYGMHYCCNIITGPTGYGSAVLIRAIEPIKGEELMESKRNGQTGVNLSNGPAKLCQALSIDKNLNGHNLASSPLKLIVPATRGVDQIVQTTRIGITKAKDLQWRFYIAKNPYVSRP